MYVDHRHAQRAYRERLKERLGAEGLPTTLTLETLRAMHPARTSNGDAPARPATTRSGGKRSGRQLSYRRTVDLVAELLFAAGHTSCNTEAERLLEPLLPIKQQKATLDTKRVDH